MARYGGEEFTVVLEEDGIEVGIELARRLLNKVKENEFTDQEHRLRCTVSIGVAEYQAGEPVAEWIARADAKLYEAKTGGRDRVAH